MEPHARAPRPSASHTTCICVTPAKVGIRIAKLAASLYCLLLSSRWLRLMRQRVAGRRRAAASQTGVHRAGAAGRGRRRARSRPQRVIHGGPAGWLSRGAVPLQQHAAQVTPCTCLMVVKRLQTKEHDFYAIGSSCASLCDTSACFHIRRHATRPPHPDACAGRRRRHG